MNNIRKIFEKFYPVNVFQGLAIFLNHFTTFFNRLVNVFEVHKSESGSHLVHLAVDAGSDDHRLVFKTEILEIVDFLLHLRRTANQRPAFDCRVGLCRMETQSADVAVFEDAFPIDSHAKSVRRIIYHFKVLTSRYFIDALNIARISIDVNRHDGRRPRGNRSFNLVEVNVSCFRVNINENGLKSVPPDCVRRGDEAVRSRYHLARYPQGLQSRYERQRAVCEKRDIFNAEIFGEFLFQSPVHLPAVGDPLAVPDLLKIRDEFFKRRQKRRRDGYLFGIFHKF